MSDLRRRILLPGDETIPSRYLPADYIQSYGSEYINSLVSNFVGFELDFQPTDTRAGNYAGARWGSGTTTPRSAFLQYSGQFMHCHGDWFLGAVDTNRHLFKVIISKEIDETTGDEYYYRKIWFDGVYKGNPRNSENYWIPDLPCTFAAAATCTSRSRIKIYSASVWGTLNSDDKAFRAVPVYGTIAAKYGMWDHVSRAFFGNAGSGDFGGQISS